MARTYRIKTTYGIYYPPVNTYCDFTVPDTAGAYTLKATLGNNTVLSAGNLVVDNQFRKYILSATLSDNTTNALGYFTTGPTPNAASMMLQLDVSRYTTSTYVNDTSYSNDSFIGFSVSTGEDVCVVVYDGTAKLVPANQTNYTITFGKYKGINDGTAESGTVGFSTGFTAVAPLYFNYDKSYSKYCDCITAIRKWWDSSVTTTIPASFMAGQGQYVTTKTIGDIVIPAFITSIGEHAFYSARLQSLRFAGNALTSLPVFNEPFMDCHVGTLYMDSNFMRVFPYIADSDNIVYSVPTYINSSRSNYMSCDTLTITANVQELAEQMFHSWDSMGNHHYSEIRVMNVLATTPPATAHTGDILTFSNVGEIRVPSASLSAYQNDAKWGGWTSKMVGV